MAIEERSLSGQYPRMTGRRIVCCLCDENEDWTSKNLLEFCKKYPDAKEVFSNSKKQNAEQRLCKHLGGVVYASGDTDNTIVADIICKRQGKIQYPYLYGCLCDVFLRAYRAGAVVVFKAPGVEFTNGEWSHIKPVMNGAIDAVDPPETQEVETVVKSKTRKRQKESGQVGIGDLMMSGNLGDSQPEEESEKKKTATRTKKTKIEKSSEKIKVYVYLSEQSAFHIG